MTDFSRGSSEKGQLPTCRCLRWIVIIPAFIVSLCVMGILGIFVFMIPKVILAILLVGVVVSIICFVWGLSARIVKKSRSKAWKIAPVASSIVFGVLVFAFLFPVFTPYKILARRLGIDTSHVRFPRISNKGIAVDSKGRIYCAIFEYQRLQVYDRDGRFIRGWFAFVPKEVFDWRLITDEHDHIHIVSSGSHDVYDSNGLLVSTKRGEDAASVQELSDTASSQTQDFEGNVYRIETHLTSKLFSKVTKISPGGLQTTIIQDPWELWPLAGPCRAWLLIMLWMLLAGVFLGIDLLIRSTQSQPTTASGRRPFKK